MTTRSVSTTWLVGVAVWATLSACAAEPAQPEEDPETINTSAPETDTEGPAPDTGGSDGTAVLLPRLPIGGNPSSSSDPAHPANQCVDVNWIATQDAAQLPAGVEVWLTGVIFDPPVFTVAETGCTGSNPPCGGYVFNADNQACDVAIAPLGIPVPPGETPTMSAVGQARCDVAASPACTAFLEAVATEPQGSIELNFPELEETTSVEETTDTLATTDTPATTDDATTTGG